jgi:hypothetical protein
MIEAVLQITPNTPETPPNPITKNHCFSALYKQNTKSEHKYMY